MRDERLQVQDSILAIKNNHCGKAGRTLHEGREVYWLRVVFCYLKTTTLARRAGHRIRDERLQVEDSILLLKRTSLASEHYI